MLGNTPIIAFVPTLDFDKARAFYVDILGLRFVDNDGFAMVLDANGTMIRIAKVQPDFKPAMFTILGWKVSDIENVVSHETGHWLWLADQKTPDASAMTMYWSTSRGTQKDPIDERNKDTLGLGDAVGARHLYPCGCALPATYAP